MSDQNNQSEQSDTAETNETTQEKISGAFDALGNGLSGLASRLLRWFALFLILYPVAASVYDPLPMPALSDVQKVALGVFIVGLLVFYLPTARSVSKIFSPEKELVAKINGASEGVLNAWSASPEKVDEMTVEDGVVRSKIIEGLVVHLVNEFDPEANKAKAPREMEIPDWELWGEKEAIKKQRHRNNALVAFGKQLFIRLPSIGQKLEGEYWNQMSKKQTKKELTDPESFLTAIENELPDLETDVTDEMRAAVEQAGTDSQNPAGESE
jgi:hypothetical protein